MVGPEALLTGVSVVGALLLIGAIVFAESGLLVGLILPGDTLLITAGFFAAQGQLPLAWVLVVVFVGAVLGDNLGYFLGEKSGNRVFKKRDGFLFRREYIQMAQAFYARHGGKTILFARFIPYVRTFAPIVAGVAHMRRPRFVAFNMIGALLWTVTFTFIGYWLGLELAERITRYTSLVFLGSLLLVFGPSIFYFATHERFRAYVLLRLKALWTAVTTPFRFK